MPRAGGGQWALRADGSWGCVCRSRVCLDLRCQSRGEWQGRVWPSSCPAAVSKGQCLGVPQLFPAQQDFQKKLLMAISGWALTHPWLGAKGCTAPAMVAPYPITVLLGRQCSCSHPVLPNGSSTAAGSHRQPFQTALAPPLHVCTLLLGSFVCPGVPDRDRTRRDRALWSFLCPLAAPVGLWSGFAVRSVPCWH